jgi:hypothetical protein
MPAVKEEEEEHEKEEEGGELIPQDRSAAVVVRETVDLTEDTPPRNIIKMEGVTQAGAIGLAPRSGVFGLSVPQDRKLFSITFFVLQYLTHYFLRAQYYGRSR